MEGIQMKMTSAALALLLLTACQQQSPSNSTDGGKVASKSPTPDDPEYIAEDPRLAQLVGQAGPAITLQMVDGQKL